MRYCSRCGTKLDNGKYCTQCGAGVDIQNIFNWDTSENMPLKEKKGKKEKEKPTGKHRKASKVIFRFFLIILAIMSVYYFLDSNNIAKDNTYRPTAPPKATAEAPAETPVSSPDIQEEILETEDLPVADKSESLVSGTVIYSKYDVQPCNINARNTGDKDALISLYDKYDTLILAFYVQAGESCTVECPSATYSVTISRGTQWIDEAELFGEDTETEVSSEKLIVPYGEEKELVF